MQKKSTPRIIKLLVLVDALRTARYTFDQLMEKIEVDHYTLYRYLDELRDVNFNIERDSCDRYFTASIDDNPRYPGSTNEESALFRLFSEPDPESPSFNAIGKRVKHFENLVAQLTFAITDEHQVTVYEHQITSNPPPKHIIEPIHFGEEHSTIVALDTHDLKCKAFPLYTIRRLSVMENPFDHAVLHRKATTDMFHIAGEPMTWVTLKLQEHVYLELSEEYPRSIPYLSNEGDTYLFHGPVAGFAGIGRFVARVFDDVEIVEPEEFKRYVEMKFGKKS